MRLASLVLILAPLLLPGSAFASSALLGTRQPGGLPGIGLDAVDALDSLRQATDGEERKGDQLEQLLVVPQRPGRNNVRYYEFDWRLYDYLDDDGVGGVRLYFYDREEEVARIAAALVREQYEELSEAFNYRPTQRIPYILYNSHREFQNTNVFFVNEYILGVTSPLDLRMALPYWGEIERFREVSTHEMAHQFTIQKVADKAAALGMESPVMRMPLWFIEGIAEYYSKNGIDRETDMFARDMLLNPEPLRGYALIDFWMDVPQAFIYTYKLGQLRVAFLADEYGERIIQAILDQSPRLGSPSQAAGFGMGAQVPGSETFEELVSRLADDTPEEIAQRFSAWMKRRYLPTYLATAQEPPEIAPVDLPGEPDAFSVGPDGQTILYRSVERETGRSRLYLADRRNPEDAVQVAVDGKPGVESLHPVLRGVTAVGEDRIAYFARHGASDRLFIRRYSRDGDGNRTRLRLGKSHDFDLAKHDLIEAGDPAFSPDGVRLAFFALDRMGRIDLWTIHTESGDLKRLTNDLYAERDVTWTSDDPSVYGISVTDSDEPSDGTLIFASDATSHRRYNLVALDPRTGATARLTSEQADHRNPYALGGGLVAFSTDARGKQDLHLYDASTRNIRRITDFVTGLGNPAPGTRGLMALGFYGGRYRIFDVPTESFLSLDERSAIDGEPGPAAPFPQEPIPADVTEYRPLALKNWRLQNGAAAVGTANVGQGILFFGDMLGDRSLMLQLAVFGSLDLTDAVAFYVDRSNRFVFGGGPFHTFTQRRDPRAPGFERDTIYLQREFGLTGLWSYPFDTFSRIETRGVIQGVERQFSYVLTPGNFLDPYINLGELREWQNQRGGFDLEGILALRYGYDTTRYRFPGGAYGGGSFILELGGGVLPFRSGSNRFHQYGILDAQYHLRLLGWSSLHLRLAGGWAGGSVFGRQFFLSSYDNLRNYSPSDPDLLGSVYAVANADLEIPLDAIIRLAFISHVEAVLGLDLGSVASRIADIPDFRTLAGVVGMNLGLGAFEVRLHFAYPIDIGGREQSPGWVPNISLRYVYF